MAAASVTSPGSLELLQPGFSKTLLGTRLEAKYLCSACKNILRRPFQAQCGHRYCSFCLTSILRCASILSRWVGQLGGSEVRLHTVL
jgi:TNF receptor-associated factor 2